MLAVLLVLACFIAVAAGNVFYEDADMQKFQFTSFKRTYNKAYSTEAEEFSRFKTFVQNLREIDMRNKEEAAVNGTAIHGINSFADLTKEEFRKRYLNLDLSKAGANKAVKVEVKKVLNGDANADWTGTLTTPVKDQAYCGSCWAFSATEQLESDSMRMLGTNYILGPQQIVSCDPVSYGCSGGWPTWAFDYVMSAGGQEQESSYPYTSFNGDSGLCSANKALNVVGISQYYQITASSASAIETAMASYVGTTGPLSICVDANNWSSYRGGIMSKCGNSIDHAVQMVGVNTAEGYWKVRNCDAASPNPNPNPNPYREEL